MDIAAHIAPLAPRGIMSHITQANVYKGLEPEFILLMAVIEMARRDAKSATLESVDAKLFLEWCDCELVPYLEDISNYEGHRGN
jgi:hypothetical protein